ncbi:MULTISPECIES: LacI family DNA-binding transcriptional regulator [unclassified Micromonospora]|uniref:LacI family DNA-binding transcriptional regulator n=1 Tax=unclassified Micromonospora TaxID=2617518 RepID=UPI001C5CE300|nr:LacI family DNA-binding transcriptional regulator [Micromonospora sp. RL09-050-HVF-A]MBW4700467.1 LacI family DNA-binding transcriptional regulator [Micromonospora sp. RL09-050-HVF-A]
MGVSLKDIAERAGVSLATVSNVVNGYRPVGEGTRQRVQRAIDELGYTPNLSARHLRRGRTGLIALAVPELTNPYFAELADVAIREAAGLGYTLLMENTAAERGAELALLEGAQRHLIDGLILSPVAIGREEVLARRARMPLVLIGEGVYDVPYDHVAIDNVAASRTATAHLVALGRRRIAFVGAPPGGDRQSAHLRIRGYREALDAAGIPFDPGLVVPTEQFGRADGEHAMRHLLSLDHPPDAVLAYNDLTAIGALRTLTRSGAGVPDDVAVAGIDDIEEGRFSNPTLTTVAPDKRAIGRSAVRRLVSRIEGEGGPPMHVQPSFHLVTRESTGPVR